jgi:transposase-like protein
MTRQTEQLWRKRVEGWKDSGLTAAEYAREIGVNPHTLTYWKWRLKARRGSPDKRPAPGEAPVRDGFVEVVMAQPEPVSPPSAPAEPLELLLGGSLMLRIPVRFDETALRRVVATLGGR